MSILVVDDSIDSQRLIRAFLKSDGHDEVIMAQSATEAYRVLSSKADENNIQLILLDIVMPDVNGIEACRKMKTFATAIDTPIIMVTAKTEKEELEKAFAAGAMDYITKPINKTELLARVRSALRLKREIDGRKAREQELLEVTRQLEAANESLRLQTSRDGLTGVANRRHFDELLAQEWERATRERQPLALLMIDIDDFKRYNDHYGHLQGDDCLRSVASAGVRALKRPCDVLARYGGEEFAAILPLTDVVGATAIGEQIRSAVEALRIPHAKSSCAAVVTISLGAYSVIPTSALVVENLIQCADRALYRAKANGRNQVQVGEDRIASGENSAI